MVQILELFGGIGSPRIALRNLGVDVKAIDYVEIDEKAVRSYNAMFQKELKYKTQDVRGYNLKPDILIHGSPCQDFSVAGKQKGAEPGSGTRSSLMWETINIIKQMGEWKPKYIIWENVRNVLSKHMRHNFNRYLEELEKLGYTNNFKILNAMEFGLPQNRNRVFTVSCLHGELFNFDTLERKPMKSIKEFLQSNDEVDDRYTIKSPSMKNRIMKTDSKTFSGILKIIEDYAECITTKQDRCPNSGIIPLGNGEYRLLTELECWRLQGYKDEDYYAALKANPGIEGKKNSALYTQAGNSIPVPIFESIFKQILDKESSDNKKDIQLITA